MRAAAVALATIALAGCGNAGERDVIAFELGWPHGALVARHTYRVAGVEAVTIGSVRLPACIRPPGRLATGLRASFERSGERVTVTLDGRRPCEPSRVVPFVGGYARAGGYVGEWSPGALVLR